MSLTQSAVALSQEAGKKARSDQEERQAKQLKNILEEQWPDQWYAYPKADKILLEGLDELPTIERHERGEIEHRSGGYTSLASVIVVWSDGIRFAYVTDSRDEGWHLVMTCPHCGCDYLDRWYGMTGLGTLLRQQKAGTSPSWTDHTCYEGATKRMASALRTEADAAKMDVETLASAAVEHAWTLRR